MPVVKELIKKESDGSISFGDYSLTTKTKKSDFECDGDIYAIKTYGEITRLEKNEMLVYESVPGSSVNNMVQSANEISFSVESNDYVNITLEMSPDTEYDVFLDDEDAGKMTTNFSGKLSLGVETFKDKPVKVVIRRV